MGIVKRLVGGVLVAKSCILSILQKEKFLFFTTLLFLIYVTLDRGGKELRSLFLFSTVIAFYIIVILRDKNLFIKINTLGMYFIIFSFWVILTNMIMKPLYPGVLTGVRFFTLASFFIIAVSINNKDSIRIYLKSFLFVISLLTICEIIIVWCQFFSRRQLLGTFTNSNHLAYFIILGVNAFLYYLLFENKAIVLPLLAVSLLTILVINSRGAILLSLFSIFYMLYAKYGKKIIILLSLMFIIIVFYNKAVFNYFVIRDVNDPYSGVYRLKIWHSAIKIFLQSPIVGVGAENFIFHYRRYQYPADLSFNANSIARYSKETRFAHNELLQVLCEFGIIGFSIFVVILYIVVRNVFKLAGGTENFVIRCNIFSICLSSLVDFHLHLLSMQVYLVMMAAMVSVLSHKEDFVILKNKYAGIFYIFYLIIVLSLMKIFPFNAEYYEKKLYATRNKKILFHLCKLNPYEGKYHIWLARYYKLHNDVPKAVVKYEEAISCAPKDPFYRTEYGDFLLSLGEKEFAIREYLNAIMLEPNYLYPRKKLRGMINVNLDEEISRIKARIYHYSVKNEYEHRLLFEK
jgi:O-antigen ligase